MEYVRELWLGRTNGYWNWEIKGIDKEDYGERVKACDQFAKEIKSIRDYYQELVAEKEEGLITG